MTRLTDISMVYYEGELCWFATTANGDIVLIPKGSSVANEFPLEFAGLSNCRGISPTLDYQTDVPKNSRIYVTNAGSPNTTTQPSVTSINGVPLAAGAQPPFVITGSSLTSPGPITAPPFPDEQYAPFVFVINTGTDSLAKISYLTGTVDPTPITGGGIKLPLKIVCRIQGHGGEYTNYQDMFVLNGNSTITRIPAGSSTPDPDPISGGGMFECQDMTYAREALYVTNPFRNSVTKITWTETAA